MAELKREYVIPLRRKTRTAPKWRRSKKAVSVLKDFVRKHMKTEDVVLCKELNELIWENGAKNPPGKVQVIALKKEFAGKEKVLVNLLSVGVENQAKVYEQLAPQKEETEVKNAEVKEKVTPKEEELKVEKRKTPKKDSEVIKND